MTFVLDEAVELAVLTHRLGAVSLDNAFDLIEGHPSRHPIAKIK